MAVVGTMDLNYAATLPDQPLLVGTLPSAEVRCRVRVMLPLTLALCLCCW